MQKTRRYSIGVARVVMLAALGSLVFPATTEAGKGGKKGGNGGQTANECQIGFDVLFRDAMTADGLLFTDGVVSDDRGLYRNKVDKVMALTGSGPGFRLDTNGGSQKLEGAGGTRELCIDLDEDGVIEQGEVGDPTDECSGGGLGFNQSGVDGNVGLDLCSLQKGDSGRVGVGIGFLLNGERHKLSYVDGCPDRDGSHQSNTASSATVTRTKAVADGDDVDEWTVVGETACLREGGIFGPSLGDVTAPFEMTLTAQQPIP